MTSDTPNSEGPTKHAWYLEERGLPDIAKAVANGQASAVSEERYRIFLEASRIYDVADDIIKMYNRDDPQRPAALDAANEAHANVFNAIDAYAASLKPLSHDKPEPEVSASSSATAAATPEKKPDPTSKDAWELALNRAQLVKPLYSAVATAAAPKVEKSPAKAAASQPKEPKQKDAKPTSSAPAKAETQKSAQASSKKTEEKGKTGASTPAEDKPRETRVCRDFQAGTCVRKGCKFAHEVKAEPAKAPTGEPAAPVQPAAVTTVAVVNPPPAGERVMEVTKKGGVHLDAIISDEERLRLERVFGVQVTNARAGTNSAHAVARAVRACVEYRVQQFAGKEPSLQIQARTRGAPASDVCRRPLFANDIDAGQLCPTDASGECEHERRAADQYYKSITALDVPLRPQDARKLMAQFKVSQIFLGVHSYAAQTGQVCDQQFIWAPRPQGGAFLDYGSNGVFNIGIIGGTNIIEDDQFWLTAQVPMQGVLPEVAASFDEFGYRIYRLTTTARVTPEPLAVAAVAALAPVSPPGIYCVGHLPVYRYGPQLAVAWVDGVPIAFSPKFVLEALRTVALKSTDEALFQRVAQRMVRGDETSDINAAVTVVRSFKAAEESSYAIGQFQPAHKGWFAWAGQDRLEHEVELNARRAGIRPRTWHRGKWFAFIGLLFGLVAIAPYPVVETWYTYRPPGMYGWADKTLVAGPVTVTLSLPIVEVVGKYVSEWSLAFAWLWWHSYVRGASVAAMLFAFVASAQAYNYVTVSSGIVWLDIFFEALCIAGEFAFFLAVWVFLSKLGALYAHLVAQVDPPARTAEALRGGAFVTLIGTWFFVFAPTVAVTLTALTLALAVWPEQAPRLSMAAVALIAARTLCGPVVYIGTYDVRLHFEQNMFAPIAFNGPLPVFSGAYGFALPGYVSTSPLRELQQGASVKLRFLDAEPDLQRDRMWATGIVFGDRFPTTFIPCQHNLFIALRNRQCAAMPAADPTAFGRLADELAEDWRTSVFPEHLTQLDGFNYDAAFIEWNCRFPSGRQRQHIEARRVLTSRHVDDDEIYRRTSFVKLEKKFVDIDEATNSDPRVITAASDFYNVLYAPYFYQLAKHIKQTFSHLSRFFIATSTSAGELGNWFDAAVAGDLDWPCYAACGDDALFVIQDPVTGRPLIVEADGSRHDAHMHELFLDWKWRVFRMFATSHPRFFFEAARLSQRTTYTTSTLGLSASYSGRTRSGDWCTSIGNSVQEFLVEHSTGRAIEQLRREGCGLRDTEKLASAIIKQQLGYELKLKLHDETHNATFLSGVFVPVCGKCYWAPKPGRLMATLGWTVTRPGPVTRHRDLASTINSFMPYCFVPFLRCYLRHAMQLLPEKYRQYHDPATVRMVAAQGIDVSDPAVDTWAFFAARYGLTAQDEIAFQVSLARASSLPFMLCDTALGRMAEVDC